MKIKIEGLDCPNCAKTLENHINKLESVSNARINFLKSYIEFESKDNENAIKDIIDITKKIEPEAKIVVDKINKSNKKLLIDIFTLILQSCSSLVIIIFQCIS